MTSRVLDLSIYGEYVGKFVARENERIIEVADSFEELLSKLKKRGIDPRKVLVDHIPEDPVYYLI